MSTRRVRVETAGVEEFKEEVKAANDEAQFITRQSLANARRVSRTAFGLYRATTGTGNEILRITMEGIFAAAELYLLLSQAAAAGPVPPTVKIQAAIQIGLVLALIGKARAVQQQNAERAARYEGLISAAEAWT